MKKSFLALCMSLLISTPTALIAAEQHPEPSTIAATVSTDLYHIRLAVQRSIGNFYMFNSAEPDQRYADAARQNLALSQQHLNTLAPQLSPAALALKAQLLNDFSAYRRQLNKVIDDIQQQGYSDLQPIADLAQYNAHVLKNSQDLAQLIAQEQPYQVPQLTQLAREQSLLMQSIASDYAARSTSIGASFFGDGEKQPLDELTQLFTDTLTTLQKHPKNTTHTQQSLRAIAVKWRYIEGSLKNYNDHSVPFVIEKYATSITQSLEQLAAQYAFLNI